MAETGHALSRRSRIEAMHVEIKVGDYDDTSLDRWIDSVNGRLGFIEGELARVINDIEAIKRIVPLADEDLGMHDAPSEC